MPEILKLALETREHTYDKRMKKLSVKIETIKIMKAFGFLDQEVFQYILKDIELEIERWKNQSSRTLSNRQLKGLEKRIHNIIDTGLQNTNCNLFLTNIPTEASLLDDSLKDVKDKDKEPVTPEHIFDTLVYYKGEPNYVLQIGPDSFVADLPCLENAQAIKNKLHGMLMNGNTIRVYTLAKRSAGSLEVQSITPLTLHEKRTNVFQKGFAVGIIFLLFSSAFMFVYMSIFPLD